MAPVLIINFKCVMPIFGNEMVSSLPGNVKHIIHKLGNTILSSVYNTAEGSFKKGYLVDNAQCNWKNIEQSFNESPNDFSILHQECRNGLDTPINNIFTDAENNPHILLQQAITPHQNGTANIFDQLYKVTNDYMFSQGDITETNGADFLGLNECTKEEAISALQNYNTYKKQLTSIETLTNILQDTLNHLGISQDNAQEAGVKIFDVLKIPVKFTTDNLKVILKAFKITLDNAQEAGVKIFDVLKIPVKFTTDNLKIILEAFNVTLDDISPTEIGKNILDLLTKPFTEATTSTTEKPNDDTNGGGTWGYVIGAVGFVAASLMAAKYVWDWYKGRTKNKEFSELEYGNLKYQILNSDKDILDTILKIKDLDDIIKMLDKLENTDGCTQINNKSIITLTSQDYDLVGLKTIMENLNQEFKNLNSLDKIFSNINSLGEILNNIYSFIKPSVNNCPTNNPILPYKITIKTFEEILQNIRKLESDKISIKDQFPLYEDSFQQLFSMLPIENTYADYAQHESTSLMGGSSSGVSSDLV
ncbi:MAG: hypothetical protein RLZZ81_1174 [Pseudomonadota bacterium]|jgi:hypothetical protein